MSIYTQHIIYIYVCMHIRTFIIFSKLLNTYKCTQFYEIKKQRTNTQTPRDMF